MRGRTAALALLAVALLALGILAGRRIWTMGVIDAPSDPANTRSFTLEDIYDRIVDGTTQTDGAFAEPVAAPGAGTMHTLNDIMEAIPCFIDHGDGTVTDRVTGLMWTKVADHGLMTDAAADAYCDALRTCGYGDWRLPMPFEISTLIDARQSNPALREGHPFEIVFSGFAYRTHNWALADDTYIILNTSNGSFGSMVGGDNPHHVWPVRDPNAP